MRTRKDIYIKWKGKILNEKRAIYFMISERGIIKYLTEKRGNKLKKSKKRIRSVKLGQNIKPRGRR